LVDVDTTYKSRSYTTETQRAKVARYAQAAAVAAAGQIPDMNSTLAMEQVGSDNSALMDSYAQKMTDAASSASDDTSSADTAAATAAVASTESVKPVQESAQQSPESPEQGFLHLTSFKDWVNETASEVGDAVSGAAKKVEEKIKGSPSPSPTPSPTLSPSTAAVAAVQSSHSQLYHRGAHTAKVTSDAIGGRYLKCAYMLNTTKLIYSFSCGITCCICLSVGQDTHSLWYAWLKCADTLNTIKLIQRHLLASTSASTSGAIANLVHALVGVAKQVKHS